jgi:excisionase family DNA binding protein
VSQQRFTKPRYGLREVGAELGLSKPTIDRRIKDGKLKAHKDGRRTFVLGEELERYVSACAKGIE